MITVMVPALNEERLLGDTVRDIVTAARQAGGVKLDIIIVNDGSVDRTAEVADGLTREHSCVRVVHNEKNIGIGESFKKVLQLARYPKFLIVAGDNDMPQALMVEVFRNAARADLVLAFFLNRETRGRWRNAISMLFQMIYMLTFNVYVMYITGPCLYPTEMLKTFRVRSKRFSIPVELTLKCLLSGCSYHEIGGKKNAIAEDGGSLKLGNLWEVVVTYFMLIVELKFTQKKFFNKPPVRVY